MARGAQQPRPGPLHLPLELGLAEPPPRCGDSTLLLLVSDL